jgi:hypothetical protein
MWFDFNASGRPFVRAITNIYIEKAGGGGWMPPFWSTVSGNRQLVQLLLDKEADVAAKDGEGRRKHRRNSNNRGITFGLTRLDSGIYW